MRRAALAASTSMAALVMAVSLAPAAEAAPHPCWSATYENKITKFNVTQVDYLAQFHWCATNGKVDTFVVDKAYANASGWTHNAGIDIRPFRPGAFGRDTFDVYLNVWGDKKAGTITVAYQGSSAVLATGEYRDYYDITLRGNGAITGTKYKYR